MIQRSNRKRSNLCARIPDKEQIEKNRWFP
jgi:hypothetical protein